MRIDGFFPLVAGRQRPTPSVLAFVERHGLPRSALLEAERLAALWGVAPDVALLRSGLASADQFYRALALECGLPFLGGPIELAAATRYPASIRNGIAPLAENADGLSSAIAPEGERLATLLANRDRLTPGLAIVTPDALRDAAFASCGPAIALRAAEALPATRPDESYRDGPTLAQLVAIYMAGLATAAALALFPAGALQALSAFCALPFLGLIAIKLGATLEPVAPVPAVAPPRARDRDLPVYSILVPLFRERRVLPKLLAAIGALDYPAFGSKCIKG